MRAAPCFSSASGNARLLAPTTAKAFRGGNAHGGHGGTQSVPGRPLRKRLDHATTGTCTIAGRMAAAVTMLAPAFQNGDAQHVSLGVTSNVPVCLQKLGRPALRQRSR